jgi:hypothetical protein
MSVSYLLPCRLEAREVVRQGFASMVSVLT